MRVAIVGSRTYADLDIVNAYVDALPDDAVVISGGAIGVDRAAEERAKTRGLQTEIYQADWAKYGKLAGMLRNRTIVSTADIVVAFWDGKSKGTKNSIDLAKEYDVWTIIRPVGSSILYPEEYVAQLAIKSEIILFKELLNKFYATRGMTGNIDKIYWLDSQIKSAQQSIAERPQWMKDVSHFTGVKKT